MVGVLVLLFFLLLLLLLLLLAVAVVAVDVVDVGVLACYSSSDSYCSCCCCLLNLLLGLIENMSIAAEFEEEMIFNPADTPLLDALRQKCPGLVLTKRKKQQQRIKFVDLPYAIKARYGWLVVYYYHFLVAVYVVAQ